MPTIQQSSDEQSEQTTCTRSRQVYSFNFVDPDFSRRLDPSVVIAQLKEFKGKFGN